MVNCTITPLLECTYWKEGGAAPDAGFVCLRIDQYVAILIRCDVLDIVELVNDLKGAGYLNGLQALLSAVIKGICL